jgi:hypothetical protein
VGERGYDDEVAGGRAVSGTYDVKIVCGFSINNVDARRTKYKNSKMGRVRAVGNQIQIHLMMIKIGFAKFTYFYDF